MRITCIRINIVAKRSKKENSHHLSSMKMIHGTDGTVAVRRMSGFDDYNSLLVCEDMYHEQEHINWTLGINHNFFFFNI